MRPFYYYEMEILEEVDKAAAEASSFVVHLYIIILGWAQRRAHDLTRGEYSHNDKNIII
jgi:hypothetical protein